jgi:deazaflavin-dependent oxidoreductase (nitroreductase family)
MGIDTNTSHMPAWMPAFNERFNNPIQRTWAPYLPPYALVVHTGRTSGKTYKTPVLAQRRGDTLSIALIYGTDAQWVRNVLAAGGATVMRGGRRYTLSAPRVVTDAARGELPAPMRRASKTMGVLTGTLEPERRRRRSRPSRAC